MGHVRKYYIARSIGISVTQFPRCHQKWALENWARMTLARDPQKANANYARTIYNEAFGVILWLDKAISVGPSSRQQSLIQPLTTSCGVTG